MNNVSSSASSAISSVSSSINKSGLIEPGVKYYMDGLLKRSNREKLKKNSILLNISIFLIFSLFFGGMIYMSYREKQNKQTITPEKLNELYQLNHQANEIQQQYLREKGDLITELPPLQNEFENVMMRLI